MKKKKCKIRRRNVHTAFDSRCYLCGVQLSFKGLRSDPTLATRDHLIPRSKGGLSARENLRPCCSRCNKAKGSFLLPYPVLSFILWRGTLHA